MTVDRTHAPPPFGSSWPANNPKAPQPPPRPVGRDTDDPAPTGRRRAIAIEVDNEPIPVAILGHVFEFVGVLPGKSMVAAMEPISAEASRLYAAANPSPDDVTAFIDTLMGGLADLLADPGQRDEWLALDLPLIALIGNDRRAGVFDSLMREWTGGRPFGNV